MAVFTAQQTAVANLYIALFNRAPDAAGLDFWATALSNGAPLAAISQSFLASSEARVIYPGAQTSEQFVSAFYQTVFGRTVDAGGLAFWSGVLNAAGGPGSDAARALFVSNIIDVASTPVGTKPVGLTDAQYAQTVLDRDTFAKKIVIAIDFAVTQKSNDVAAAKLAFAVPSTPAPSAPDVPAGTVIRLTTGADTKVGGAGNDTFDGSLNGGVATLSTADNLDGGAGIDTLNASLISSSASLPTLRNIEIVNLSTQNANAVLDLGSATGVTNANIVGNNNLAYIYHVGTAALSVANQNATAGFSGSTASVLSLNIDTVGQDDGKAIVSLATNGAAPLATTYNLVVKEAYVNLTGATAGAYTVAATGVNMLNLPAGNVKTLDVTGAGSVDFFGAALSALTRFTAQDGGVKLTSTGTGLTTVTTGAGADTITANATSLTMLNVGAGNDTVTLSAGALSATSRVGLGAGNDTITLAVGSVAGATVNGGDGDDIINTGTVTHTAAGASAVTEVATVTFTGTLASDSSITIAGLKFTSSNVAEGAGSTSLAESFANQAVGVLPGAAVDGSFSGKLNGYSTGAAVGNTVTFTAATAGDKSDLVSSGTPGISTIVVTTQGAAAVTPVVGSLDTLTGGLGHDTFTFNTADVNTTAGAVTAIITDFKTGEDKIRVTMSGTNYAGDSDTFVKGAIFNSLADLLTAANTAISGARMYYVAQFGTDSYLVTDKAGGGGHGYTNVIKLVGVAVADGIIAADLIGDTIPV